MSAISVSQAANIDYRSDIGVSSVNIRSQLDKLLQEALHHRALQHPYLGALATGSVPDLRWAIKDFACQYYGYSTYFPTFLNAVIYRLDRTEHREALLQNLDEETGNYPQEDLEVLAKAGIEPDWIIGIPHPQLFQRFQKALDLKEAELKQPELEVICWRNQLLALLSQGSMAEAVGALGLGTESIVSECYRPIVQALSWLDDLSARDTVFFSMHTLVDDAHQETLLEIAADLAYTSSGLHDLQKGMINALNLRAKFWDWMYERALTQGKLSV